MSKIDVNAHPYRSAESLGTLESDNNEHMSCSAYSPDFNLIEHAWDALAKSVSERTSPRNRLKTENLF